MSDYLSDEEQAARLRSWWVANGINVLVAAVVALGGFLAYQYYTSSAQQSAETSTAAFIEYREATEGEREALGNRLIEQFPGTAQHALVLLRRAATATEEARLDDAVKLLNEAIEVASNPLLADLARIRVARVLQGLNRSDEALAKLAQVTNSGYRSWALEVQGDVLLATNQVAKAHEAYGAAIDALSAGEERPILQVKRDNTAPSNGEYVAFQDTLDDALRKAEQTLSEASEDASQETNNE